MEHRRIVLMLEAIAAQAAGPLIERMCTAAAQQLSSAGVGVVVGTGATGDASLQTVAHCGTGQAGEALHNDLGEGPAVLAHRSGSAVLVDDLAADDTWPAFAPAALAAGIRSVFSFPLRRGSAHLGAFTLYRGTTGALTSDEHADALVVARFVLDLFLTAQAGRTDTDLDGLFDLGSSAQIHQAVGMLSVQLGVAVAASLAMLRARAYTDGRSLQDLAEDVVARRVRLEPDA